MHHLSSPPKLATSYKNQRFVGEDTLRIFSPIGFAGDSDECLFKLLTKAKVLSEQDLKLVMECAHLNSFPLAKMLPRLFPSLIGISNSLISIATKILYSKLSMPQGVVAANHMFLTGCCLAEALALVGRPESYSILDFLREVGVDVGAARESATSSRSITADLLEKSIIDQFSLRVAIRLRYLICHNKIETTVALGMFDLYKVNKIEPEYLIAPALISAA